VDTGISWKAALMSEERVSREILKFLSRQEYQPRKARDLAKAMGIGEAEYGDFRASVKALQRAGRVVLGGGSLVMLPEPDKELVGTFRANPRGFGFIIPVSPLAHGDLYVPNKATGGAMTGDVVRAEVRRGRGADSRGRMFSGKIVEILEREHRQFVGALCQEMGRWFVRPDGNVLHGPIFVADVGAKGANAGSQVVVDITEYPTEHRDARGVITKVLGPAGDPEVDTLSVIHQYGLPLEFDEDVMEEARRVTAEFNAKEAMAHREDLRKLNVLTIDPVDARDFDDAISLEPVGRNRVELGVHIADVSYFVQEGSKLDACARERTTSVYFPRHVVPMLPEVLSNGLCSLQEKQDRLTKSVFITYDREGNVVGERFCNGLIRSGKRLTYEQASGVLEGKTGRLGKKVVELLHVMEGLARRIEKRRVGAGMLTLDLPEVELVHDDNGKVVGVAPADTSYSHRVIEMFMVEANEAVARLMTELEVPHMRRVHPWPDSSAGKDLKRFVRALGLKAPDLSDRPSVQALLRDVVGKPYAYSAQLAVLKSMSRAEYSPEIAGHYALASEHYSHFTSPIRRYPDLTIHRLLGRYVAGALSTPAQVVQCPDMEALHAIGTDCTQKERRADYASREVTMIKSLRLLEERIGEELEGVVTGIAQFGMFVQLTEFLVEGLLRFGDLADDWWEVDASRGWVSGTRTGRRYTLGQPLKVEVVGVDIPGRQMELVLSGADAKEDAAKRSRPGGGKADRGGSDRSRGSSRGGSRSSPKGTRGPAKGGGRSSGGGPSSGGGRSSRKKRRKSD
jgi:ribonuclease R